MVNDTVDPNDELWSGVKTWCVKECFEGGEYKVTDSWIDNQDIEIVVDIDWERYKDFTEMREWMKELGWIFTDGMWIRERLYETEWYYGCNDDVIKYEKDRKDGKHFDGITDEWDKYFD